MGDNVHTCLTSCHLEWPWHYVLLGIANVEEFSLLVEGQKEEKEDVEKMGTMKRVCWQQAYHTCTLRELL